jgi:probable rRNA maturation factor
MTPRPAAARDRRLNLTVQYRVRARGVPAPAQVRRWARAALERDARLTVRIVGDGEARALNRNFRGKDRPTNVLTFVMSERPRLEGDIALCAPLIAREARRQGKSAAAHYAHLVVHGVLHLQGYDHESEREARAMERRESEIVARLGFPDPYLPSHGERARQQ